jgi:starch-binding outer membrane protein, SusD/RagB family
VQICNLKRETVKTKKMKAPLIKLFVFGFFALIFCSSCRKGWLDAKPLQSLVIPNTIADMQAILDNTAIFNESHPYSGEEGTDNYYLTHPTYSARSERDRNVYSWASSPDFYAGATVTDWNNSYNAIFYANTILDNINSIQPDSTQYAAWANVKGTALFYRSYIFYQLAQIFCKPYIPSSANNDQGIIIKLRPDVNTIDPRATIKQTYDQVLNDLLEAKQLLPLMPPTFRTRPSKVAVFAMLSRVYLSMQRYPEAFRYSDSCLSYYNTLLDYNSATVTNTYPIYAYNTGTKNPEVMFHSVLAFSNILPHRNSNGIVDSVLYQSYAANDTRQTVFFKINNDRRVFVGSYTNNFYFFSGLATDEIYLNRAECHARMGSGAESMQDLNTLLAKRWKTGTFIPLTSTDANDALTKVLTERRKELCFRGIRWTDLRRLNQDQKFSITLTHGLLKAPTSIIFTLPANDNRYIYPIPKSEVLYNNIEQNPR